MSKVIAISNQKGGVSKTTTTVNLGIGLAREGKRVLLVDADPQGSMTTSLGVRNQDGLEISLATIMKMIIEDKEIEKGYGLIHQEEGVDLLPGNIELSAMEVSLLNVMSRETILKQYIEQVRPDYDYIIIDCMPSLGMITINALVAADSVLIPVQPAYLSIKGLEQLIVTISKLKRHLNPSISFEGILMSMVDARTNYARESIETVKEVYGRRILVFETMIPQSVKAAELSAAGRSCFSYIPTHKVTEAYASLVREVLSHE